jgi:hypothetical protein
VNGWAEIGAEKKARQKKPDFGNGFSEGGMRWDNLILAARTYENCRNH